MIPRTHLLANSIAPTATIKSVPPAPAARGPFWQIVAAAAVLVGLGAGLGQLKEREAHREGAPAVETGLVVRRTAASAKREPLLAPRAAEPKKVEEPAVSPGNLAVAKAQPARAPVEPPALAAATDKVEPELGSHSGAGEKNAVESTKTSRAVRVKRTSTKSTGPLPAQPSREQVVATMKAAMPALNRCTDGRKGSVSAQLTVRGSGRVSYALIQGSFAGTREGSCLATALRDVRFPAFSEPSLRLTYPLQF